MSRYRSIEELQEDVGGWAEENFGNEQDIKDSLMEVENVDAILPLLGVEEEAGELVHSVLKRTQGIRLDEDDVGDEAEKDAVGDIIVYLADFCQRRNLNMAECIEEAWDNEVSNREWDSQLTDFE